MPYCVKCGVELAPSEPKCPLCNTQVMHPDEPWQKPGQRPYPEHLEVRHVNRQYGAHLASIVLLVPVLVCLLCDFLISMRLSWSLYVLGAGGFLFCCALLPFYTKEQTPYLSLLLDTLAALMYLYLIAVMSGNTDWFWRLALPLTVLLGATIIACVWIFRRKNSLFLINLSYTLILCSMLLIAYERAIDLFVLGIFKPLWSFFAMVPLLALAVIFRIVNRKRRLLEDIRKRLYI